MEVGQKWRVVCPEEGIDSVEVWLNEKGHLIGETLVAGSVILCAAINHPESIIRAPRLTETEINIMRSMGTKWASLSRNAKNERVILWQDKPEKSKNGIFYGAISIAYLNTALFPSVKPGECIGLEEAER